MIPLRYAALTLGSWERGRVSLPGGEGLCFPCAVYLDCAQVSGGAAFHDSHSVDIFRVKSQRAVFWALFL